MRWIMALLAVLLTVFLIMPIHYRWIGHVNHNWMLITKVLPTLLCAAFAGTALLNGGGRYAMLIFIGLCICAAADVMLGIHFVTGGALFLLGHLFYSGSTASSGSKLKSATENALAATLDAEAVRVVSASPRWIPAMKDGFPIKVSYNVLVVFQTE